MTTRTGAETITVDETDTTAEPINLDKMIGEWDKDGKFKEQVSKRYKQFYHKTDKVCPDEIIQQEHGYYGTVACFHCFRALTLLCDF